MKKPFRTQILSLPEATVINGTYHDGVMSFLTYAIFSPLLYFGFYYIMASRPIWLDLSLLGLSALLIMLACSLRFKIEFNTESIVFKKSCIGWTFSTIKMSLEETEFQVTGMGNYGEPGDWPAKFYCEIKPDGKVHQEIYVGLPSEAEWICSALIKEKINFLQKR